MMTIPIRDKAGDVIDLFPGNKGTGQSASLSHAENNPAKLNFY